MNGDEYPYVTYIPSKEEEEEEEEGEETPEDSEESALLYHRVDANTAPKQ
jgi:hypothetical protein